MTICYVDSSAWAKRFHRELGSDWIDRFWARKPAIACSTLGLIEVLSAVARRGAGANVDRQVTRSVLREVQVDFAGFSQIPFDESVIDIARTLPGRLRLRGADTVHLASALRLRQATADTVVLVASDDELLRAAAGEGIEVLDPRSAPV